jgi:hypothetical protein
MLDIDTFDNLRGGNVVYKALAHPLAAEKLAALVASLNAAGRVAIYDPEGIAAPLLALAPGLAVADVYVHDTLAVGKKRGAFTARPLLDLPQTKAASVLIAAFDAGRHAARIAAIVPEGVAMHTLDAVKLPPEMLTNRTRYLDAVNFAINFAFFRDDERMRTRLATANYWAGYGAKSVRFWLRLYSASGAVLAEWEQQAPAGAGGVVIESDNVRRRFDLAPFTGQLIVHAIGVAGHDVVKYALDTEAVGEGVSLSVTHDANAWPSERFAGLPAPRADETVTLWLQNSHAVPIPAGTIALERMGSGVKVALDEEIAPFATRAIDVATLLPGLHWPAQIELHAGRHVVRPRYEVTRAGRTRIAHVNVERADLRPDPGIANLPAALGRGFLLPFPVLPRTRFRSIVQPNPMAHEQDTMPLRLDVFDASGRQVAEKFLGCLKRDHDLALDLDEVLPQAALAEGGHAELCYDFRDGGTADGWLHALFRYEDRHSGHAAECSFGAHVFNTLMTWKGEPQSYSGPPPGLSTRLFLKLGHPSAGGAPRESFCVLIYAASAQWHAQSSTTLELHDEAGACIATAPLAIACSGSAIVRPSAHFSAADLRAAGASGYVLIRDTTCRIFGYHGVDDGRGAFSLDHMFGF